MANYKFTGKTIKHEGIKLHQIQRSDTGEIGGWIESKENLRQSGNCWVDKDSKVLGHSIVKGDALVKNSVIYDSTVKGSAEVVGSTLSDMSMVSGKAKVSNSKIQASEVKGHAIVVDSSVLTMSYVGGYTSVYNSTVYNRAKVLERATVRDSEVGQYAVVGGDVQILNTSGFENRYALSGVVVGGKSRGEIHVDESNFNLDNFLYIINPDMMNLVKSLGDKYHVLFDSYLGRGKCRLSMAMFSSEDKEKLTDTGAVVADNGYEYEFKSVEDVPKWAVERSYGSDAVIVGIGDASPICGVHDSLYIVRSGNEVTIRFTDMKKLRKQTFKSKVPSIAFAIECLHFDKISKTFISKSLTIAE